MGGLSRRGVDGLLASVLLVGSGIVLAQRSSAVRRVGFLDVNPPAPDSVRELAESLRALGWLEGQNLLIARRHANGSIAGLKPMAEELVHEKVDVIVTGGPNPTLAAIHATSTIPIVFYASDPIGSGLVTSLSRPGRNVTGFSSTGNEADAKLLSFLREMVPTLHRIGRLETVGNPQFRLLRGPLSDACRALGLEPVFVDISTAAQIDSAIGSLKRQGVQALLLTADGFGVAHGPEIIDVALRYGLPTAGWEADFVRTAKAIVSFSASGRELRRRLAYYVDRILRGAKPGDLPVEQPTEFDLVINVNTAARLGLTVPRSLLLRADEVIR